MKKVAIIVPCYNEEDSLTTTIEGLLETFKELTENFHIIIVDDGSTDKTFEIASSTKANTILKLPCNLGVGAAFQTGLKFANENDFDCAIKFDGDGQHRPEFIKNLIQAMKERSADVVVGSRFLASSKGYRSTFLRRLGIMVLNFEISLLTGFKITDATSGMRCYSKTAINLFSHRYPTFDYPEPEEFIYSRKFALKVEEEPVKMSSRKAGVSSITPHLSIYFMIKTVLAIFTTALREKSEL